MKNLYKKEPIRTEDGMYIFSEVDHYVENYEKISKDHLAHHKLTGKNPFMDETHWEDIESSTEKLILKHAEKTPCKILDVGVGMGRLLNKFPSYERYGIDISKDYLSYAKDKGINVCFSLVEDMPYKDDYFDIVISTDVLEHVLDLNLAITRILEVLKPDGIFVLRVPYKEDLAAYLHEDYPYELVHLRNFDEYSLQLLFEKVFKVEVLEFNVVGFMEGKLIKGIRGRYFQGAVNRFLKLIKKINIHAYIQLSKWLKEPTEINMVLRNSK